MHSRGRKRPRRRSSVRVVEQKLALPTNNVNFDVRGGSVTDTGCTLRAAVRRVTSRRSLQPVMAAAG